MASTVADAMLYFDGQRYELERFVIMPNHVHLLIQMRSGFELRKQLSGNMRFTGRKLNGMLNKDGAFWQSEPFDHVVRSLEQLVYLQKYILENPANAGIRAGEFLYWENDYDEREVD